MADLDLAELKTALAAVHAYFRDPVSEDVSDADEERALAGITVLGDAVELLIARVETAEAKLARMAAVVEAAKTLRRNCRIGECRPNCDECDAARLAFDAALGLLSPADPAPAKAGTCGTCRGTGYIPTEGGPPIHHIFGSGGAACHLCKPCPSCSSDEPGGTGGAA